MICDRKQCVEGLCTALPGDKVGVTAVLHTWGQTMQHHIHLYCMVTGGVLVSTTTRDVWLSVNPGFLFSVVELSTAFRYAFCKGLMRLVKRSELRFGSLHRCGCGKASPDDAGEKVGSHHQRTAQGRRCRKSIGLFQSLCVQKWYHEPAHLQSKTR